MDSFKNLFGFFFPSRNQIPEPEREAFVPPVSDRVKEIPPNREVILVWEAASRPFYPRNAEYFRRLVSLVAVVGVLLILAGQIPLLILIISMSVLFYVLSSVEPVRVKYEIDNYGILYVDHQYYWQEFKYFFFTKEGDIEVLNVDTRQPYPGRLILVLESVTTDQLKTLLSTKIPFRSEPPTTFLDSTLRHISSKMSLD